MSSADALFSLVGRAAIVTGAGSGIGLATAQCFAQLGASVMLVDRNPASLEKAAAVIEKAVPGARLLTAVCDVSREPQVAKAVSRTVKRLGHLDVVVNCAGLMVFKPIEEHTAADWHRVLDVDLLGAFFFIKYAFGSMKKGSAIVNVASVHAVETTALVAAYAAAKAALVSLTHTASIEGKKKGIRVNAVLPGAIDTPMLWNNPNIKSGLEVVSKHHVGAPEDVARAIAFLSSPAAQFIDGASLLVDGGRLSHL